MLGSSKQSSTAWSWMFGLVVRLAGCCKADTLVCRTKTILIVLVFTDLRTINISQPCQWQTGRECQTHFSLCHANYAVVTIIGYTAKKEKYKCLISKNRYAVLSLTYQPKLMQNKCIKLLMESWHLRQHPKASKCSHICVGETEIW